MTQGNCRISKRTFIEVAVLMMYQKPEALKLTNNTLNNEHLQVKLYGQNDMLPGTQQLPMPPLQRRGDREAGKIEEQIIFIFCLLVLFCYLFVS